LPGPSSATTIQQDDTAITDHLEGAVDLNRLIVPPNAADEVGQDLAQTLMRIINLNGLSASQSVLGNTVIEPGKIGVILNNGRVEVCGQGRFMIASPRSNWVGIYSLTDNPIQYETLTIVRVQKGQYGLAMQDGRPVVLGEGVHARNSRLFQHNGFVDVNQKHIHHGTVHIIMVPTGEYSLVIENNVPKILRAGRYVIDSNFFVVNGFVNVNQDHIQHQTIHIIRVPKGKVALVSNNNKPLLLPQGTYTFNAQVFSFTSLRDVNEAVIVHGTITRFRVRNGEIGLAWDNNKPVFIEKPDFYEVDSPNFTFVNCVNAFEKQIILGSCKRIIVYDGEVGISYVNGKLDILQPNTHVFDAVERIFKGFLSTKQQAIPLIEPGSKDAFLRCDTKDFVEVGLKAAVFYRIGDPAKSLITVGDEEAISRLIRETSIATLQGIMRSSALNQVAQNKAVHAISEDQIREQHQLPASTPIFFDKVHDEFISKLYDTFKKLYGIEISNIRIESFKIMNAELADNISKQAIITAQTETKLTNLESQREIATAEMERDSAVTRIKTQASAQQLATDTQARNSATLAEATAKAEAMKIEAQGSASALLIKTEAESNAKATSVKRIAEGEAQALLLKAEAEAKAIEMKAAAEKKRAQDLSSTPLGQQLALLTVQSEMVTKALTGVQKVIYLPSNANLGSTPMQLFGMPGLGIPGLEDVPDGADKKRVLK